MSVTGGDPRLIMGSSGTRMQFSGGQPLMDRGLENLVIISLFTSQGWCGNKFLKKSIGSDFEVECSKPITVGSLNRIRNAAIRCLSSDQLGQVVVNVTNPSGQMLKVSVQIARSGESLILTKDRSGWSYQVADPAYAKVTD